MHRTAEGATVVTVQSEIDLLAVPAPAARLDELTAGPRPDLVPHLRERASWEDHEVQLLADVLRPWRAKFPRVPVYEDVALFTPAQALVHHAGSASLVVVGRNAGTGWGEVVRALVRRAACPVAVVPDRTTP
ncbi:MULTISPECIES: hypothetical protein [unclassified Streptomyces]|uniref:hypothetical protein n=1 Tax=unclassified Streptomyces TaxID=2593676 RepID=UPI003802E2F9